MITKEEVQHIAGLARIGTDEKEIEKLQEAYGKRQRQIV
jgi:Asp-tRNA(Asn)/Glu-tRNA(Gln) amidotransferase C subunit